VYLNGALGLTSVMIQVKILVPWHDVISEQMSSLEQQMQRVENRLGGGQVASVPQELIVRPEEKQASFSNTYKIHTEAPRAGFFWWLRSNTT
jgi:hypothetical protein